MDDVPRCKAANTDDAIVVDNAISVDFSLNNEQSFSSCIYQQRFSAYRHSPKNIYTKKMDEFPGRFLANPLSATGDIVEHEVERARKVSKKVVDEVFMPKNYWRLALTALTTGFAVFTLFTVSTLVRGLYTGAWIGSVAIGAIFGTMYLLASAYSSRGLSPIFGIEGILINLSIFNMRALRRNGQKSKRTGERYEHAHLHLIPAILLLITLIGAAFASAGICRAILGASAYQNAAKVPSPGFDAGKVFFIEFFGMTVFHIFSQQMVLTGVRVEAVAVLSAFYWTAMQAIGYDISSASYNMIYWLSVNAIGSADNTGFNYWHDWWVYLVATLASAAAALAINKLTFWLRNSAILRDIGKYNTA